jgi:acyl-CoA thioesterase
MDALALAKTCADAMWAEDAASRSLGMEIVAIEPGHAVLAMTVTDRMVNGHGMCHGGYIFTLADSAFAFACNSHNQRAVAQHCAITFITSARRGDRLVARAIERSRVGRSGMYDITVALEEGPVVAEFRGHSRTIEGEWIPGAPVHKASAKT